MTDIGLSLVRTAGRAAKPMRAEVGRALTPDDLAALEVERGIKAPPLKKLADRTGNGPSHKMTNVNVNVDLAARIESARRRVGWTIDNEPAGPALPSPDGESVA
jgi:hypothetical protein